jgi:hypothetical protein
MYCSPEDFKDRLTSAWNKAAKQAGFADMLDSHRWLKKISMRDEDIRMFSASVGMTYELTITDPRLERDDSLPQGVVGFEFEDR